MELTTKLAKFISEHYKNVTELGNKLDEYYRGKIFSKDGSNIIHRWVKGRRPRKDSYKWSLLKGYIKSKHNVTIDTTWVLKQEQPTTPQPTKMPTSFNFPGYSQIKPMPSIKNVTRQTKEEVKQIEPTMEAYELYEEEKRIANIKHQFDKTLELLDFIPLKSCITKGELGKDTIDAMSHGEITISYRQHTCCGYETVKLDGNFVNVYGDMIREKEIAIKALYQILKERYDRAVKALNMERAALKEKLNR